LALGLFLRTVLVCRNGLYQYMLSDSSHHARIEVIFKCSPSGPVVYIYSQIIALTFGVRCTSIKYQELTMKCTLRYLINLFQLPYLQRDIAVQKDCYMQSFMVKGWRINRSQSKDHSMHLHSLLCQRLVQFQYHMNVLLSQSLPLDTKGKSSSF